MRELARSSACLDALDVRNRAFAMRLAMGVTAARGTLDDMLDAHLRPGLHLEPRLRDALRLSTFELLYLSTSSAVAVSQGVELARRVSARGIKLANAVLRRVAADDVLRLEAARARVGGGGHAVCDLALVGALPLWLVRELVASRGTGFTRDLVLSLADPAPVCVAVNTRLRPREQMLRVLADAGLSPHELGVAGAVRLDEPQGLASSGLVQRAEVIPADLSAQLVSLVALPDPGGMVLELGQGRATKTLLLSLALHERRQSSQLISVELNERKVAAAKRRLEVSGFGADCRCVCFDGRELDSAGLPEALDQCFQTVLVDAPCSGVGTLRRHPEIAWNLDPTCIRPSVDGSLPALQLSLLVAAASRVSRGGSLVYSTCSPLRQEDEDVVEAFLASDTGQAFSLAPALGAFGLASADDVTREFASRAAQEDGSLCFGQTLGGGDAHFCARLVRETVP